VTFEVFRHKHFVIARVTTENKHFECVFPQNSECRCFSVCCVV